MSKPQDHIEVNKVQGVALSGQVGQGEIFSDELEKTLQREAAEAASETPKKDGVVKRAVKRVTKKGGK